MSSRIATRCFRSSKERGRQVVIKEPWDQEVFQEQQAI